MTKPRPADGEAGFTIVELVVCLGLLALMTGLAAEGLSLVRRGGATMERAEQADGRRAVDMYVRRTLERAVPVFAAQTDGTPALLFSGEPDRLRLVSRSNRRIEGGGLVLVEIRVEVRDGRRDLVTIRQPISTRDGGEGGREPHLLLEDIDGLEFRYLGQAPDGSDSGWLLQWINPNTLPRLVQVNVKTRGSGLHWLPLTIAIPSAEPATS
jgi:hypothetical protein